MAKNDKDKRPVVQPVAKEKSAVDAEAQREADEWTQAEAKARAQEEVQPEGFFEKAKAAVKHALHLDEPGHMSHATPDLSPEEAARVKEAHRIELGEQGAQLKGVEINKVPGRLRKFMSNK